jgi:hypothetical protein
MTVTSLSKYDFQLFRVFSTSSPRSRSSPAFLEEPIEEARRESFIHPYPSCAQCGRVEGHRSRNGFPSEQSTPNLGCCGRWSTRTLSVRAVGSFKGAFGKM